jgi:hypothetical protein
VRLAQAVVRLAVRDGSTQARITLEPAELGRVEIHLRYQAGGVAATLLADGTEAAQALVAAAGELRRSLEAQGVAVLALDVRAQQDERRSENTPADPDEVTGGRAVDTVSGDGVRERALDEALASPTRSRLGTELDVLA